MHGPLALAHNGNIVNTPALRDELLARGFGLTATSDSEVMTLMLAAAGGKTWEERIERTLPAWKGAFSLVLLAADRVLAVRDPWGFRPLSRRPPPARRARRRQRDVRPVDARLRRDLRGPAGRDRHAAGRRAAPPPGARRRRRRQARCTFEFVYFSRPDSVWNGRNVHHARERLGAELAAESPGRRRRRDPGARTPRSRPPSGTPGPAACRSTTA